MSGVIQGSVLSTSMFTIFIDPLLRHLDQQASAHAEELKFLANLKQVVKDNVNRNVTRVYEWSVEMDMPLSIKWSLVMHYGED